MREVTLTISEHASTKLTSWIQWLTDAIDEDNDRDIAGAYLLKLVEEIATAYEDGEPDTIQL